MLLCFGSPLIDIIATVDENFLKKYKLTPDNAIHVQVSHQQIFKEVLSYKHKILFGGSVTNTVRVYQWIAKKANNVFYVGTIGCDKFGQMIKKKLEEEQICSYLIENRQEETGKCAVLVTGKHRSLVTNLGASKVYDVQNLDSPSLQEAIKICDVLYISTFFLGVSIDVVKQVIRSFKKQKDNKKLVINLGACFICEKYPDEVKFMFHNADLVVGNDKEFLSFAKISDTYLPEETLEKNIINMSKFYAINQKPNNYLLVITRGADSVITYKNGVIQYHKVEPVKNIVDTNGAGDAFIGGFLAKFIENLPLEDCIECGKWCAKNIIQCIGCDFDNKLVYK